MAQIQLEDPTETVTARLLDEIEQYLALVDACRAEGIEPAWANDESLPEWWLEEHLPYRRAGNAKRGSDSATSSA